MDIEILLKKLAKPAQRAIQSLEIKTLEELSNFREKEIFELHGIGKNAINIIKEVLEGNGFKFRDE